MRGRLGERSGWTMSEVLVVVALAALLAAVAVPSVAEGVMRARERAAVRLVAARLRLVRVEAMQRSRAVALRFIRRGEVVRFQMAVDGDDDGVRAADVASGVDAVIGEEEGLEQFVSGVRFAIVRSLPGIEPEDDGVEAGGDPLRIGAGEMVSFGADGAGSSGTIYLAGAADRQFAVRVAGVTGRVRMFLYQPVLGRWVEG